VTVVPLGDNEYTSVVGKDPAGRTRNWLVRPVRQLSGLDSSLVTEIVQDHQEVEFVRKTLPEHGHKAAESLLDNEIRALVRLSQRYPDGSFPEQFPKLVGYNFDLAEPFVLMTRYARPMSDEGLRTLLTDERRIFMVNLFRALERLAAVDLVHGSVGLSSICWDGSVFQLVNFEHALSAGERLRSGAPPAHPGDDVLAAGHLVYQLTTGRRPSRRDEVPDLTGQPPAIAGLLRGLFASDPARRPSAVEVLDRLSATASRLKPVDVDTPMVEGRRRFDQIRPQRKKAPTAHANPRPVPTVPARTKPPSPLLAIRVSVGLAVALVIATAVVLWVIA
jgi:hypothetical protein